MNCLIFTDNKVTLVQDTLINLSSTHCIETIQSTYKILSVPLKVDTPRDLKKKSFALFPAIAGSRAAKLMQQQQNGKLFVTDVSMKI